MAARTTTKTATAKAPADEVVYDFDGWTEDDEEKALAAAVPAVKYIIVEGRFVGRFVDGDIIEVPLQISLEDVDALQEQYASQIDQFKAIITALGGEEVAAKFVKHDLIEAAIMTEKYFRAVERVQKAAFPES